MLQIFAWSTQKQAVQFPTLQQAQFVAPTLGESIPVSVANVLQLIPATSTLACIPQSWAGWTGITLAIGNGISAPPIAGTCFLQSGIELTAGMITTGKRYLIVLFVAGDDFTNLGAINVTGNIFVATGTTPTTWENASQLQEITVNLGYSPAAADIQTALNNTAWITAEGGVVVTAGGQGLYFFATWNTAGARTLIIGNATNLAPLSVIETGQLNVGTTQAAEIQTIKIGQNAAALATLTTDSASAGITVTTMTVGGGGVNAKYSVVTNPMPYGGSFSVTIRGVESQLIPWGCPPVDSQGVTGMQTYLQGLTQSSGALVTGATYTMLSFAAGDDFTNIGGTNATGSVFTASGATPTTWTHSSILTPTGPGNVAVSNPSPGTYLLGFQGALAGKAMGAITADASQLLSVPFKTGYLNLATAGVQLLLNGAASVQTNMVLTGIPPGQAIPQELIRVPITLNNSVVDTAMFSPPTTVAYARLDDSGNILIGGSARLCPVGNGFKFQTYNGATWEDGLGGTHS